MTIFIYSDNVRSGKTTRLLDWIGDRRDLAGILTPDINKVRIFRDLESQRGYPFEVTGDEFTGDTFEVGSYSFSVEAFRQARMVLRRAFLRRPRWLIIDEIGPLELAGSGFEPVAGRIIRWYRNRPETEKLLLVVRDHLLESLLDTYQIKDWRRFSP